MLNDRPPVTWDELAKRFVDAGRYGDVVWTKTQCEFKTE